MVGTLMSNRTGIPKEVKAINNREDLSTNIYWGDDNDIVLPSYVVKTKSRRKTFCYQQLRDLYLV